MDENPAWSVDPTLHFDRLHVVESLGAGYADRSGRRLFDELESLCASTPAQVHYHQVNTRAEFFAVMQSLVSEAESGRFPLLHLEAHGAERPPGNATTSRGFVLSSGEVIPWKEIAPQLVAINKATRLRFIVFVATCFGADIATLVNPLDGAPARVLIGPRQSILMGDLETGTFTFYRTLLRERDGARAANVMNEATGGAFFPFTAEWLFLQILKGYYDEMTTESQIAARVERFIAPFALAGVQPWQLAQQRHEMRARLRDRRAVFDAAYRNFFFIDECPENIERFRMTFESCFEEGDPSRV